MQSFDAATLANDYQAGAISPEAVGRVRAASKARQTPWTRTELSALGAPR